MVALKWAAGTSTAASAGAPLLRAVGGGGHLVRSETRSLAGDLVQQILVADADDAGSLATRYVMLDGGSPQSAPPPIANRADDAPPSGPYHGVPHAIPGRIELVDFDHGSNVHPLLRFLFQQTPTSGTA